MSKIGNYNLEVEEELRDQLNELGFESLQDALGAGWELYEGELVKRKDELTKAHEAWLKEKKATLEDLKEAEKILLKFNAECPLDTEFWEIGTAGLAVQRAIKFIEEAHD